MALWKKLCSREWWVGVGTGQPKWAWTSGLIIMCWKKSHCSTLFCWKLPRMLSDFILQQHWFIHAIFFLIYFLQHYRNVTVIHWIIALEILRLLCLQLVGENGVVHKLIIQKNKSSRWLVKELNWIAACNNSFSGGHLTKYESFSAVKHAVSSHFIASNNEFKK